MQPFQLFSCSGRGIAAMAGAAMQPWQPWQPNSGSTLAIAAQQHRQRSSLPAIPAQPCSLAAMQPCSLAAVQPCSHAALQLCTMQSCSIAASQHCSANLQLVNPRYQPCSFTAFGLAVPMQSLKTLATVNSLTAQPLSLDILPKGSVAATWTAIDLTKQTTLAKQRVVDCQVAITVTT